MSENKGDSTENSEKEPDVIFVQFDGGTASNDQNVLLYASPLPLVADKTTTEENCPENNGEILEENCTENSGEVLEEVDSPDLVNIEDYKNREGSLNSPENGEDRSTAVLCETTLESDLSCDLNGVEKDGEIKFFQIVNVDPEENINIIADIPNEVLVYTCQPETDNILNKYPCKTCGILVGCIFCLKSHYESIHLNLGIIQYKCEQTSYLKNYTEICHKCNLVCESKEEMFDHRKIHFVSCDVCDMSFDSALFLSNHCKTAHEKFEVIISCDLCEQWFKQLQELSDHYKSYHEMILCIVCFKRFATVLEMDQHHTTHKIVMKHTESVLPYACSKCNKAFAEISQLSGHLTKVHPKKKVTDSRVVLFKLPTKKKSKSKREMKFDDCGGLSQVKERKDRKKKRKNEDD